MKNITGIKSYLFLIYQKLFKDNLLTEVGGDFNSFNFWLNQIADNNIDEAVSYPALFIDITPYDTNYFNNRITESQIKIDLYIAHDFIGGTRYGDPNQESSLSYYGLVEKVHRVYDGISKTLLTQNDYTGDYINITDDSTYYDFYPMDKGHVEYQKNYKSISLTKVSYVYTIVDFSKHYEDKKIFTFRTVSGLTMNQSGTTTIGTFGFTPYIPPTPTIPPYQSGFTDGFSDGYVSGITDLFVLQGYWNSAQTIFYVDETNLSSITYIQSLGYLTQSNLNSYWNSAQTIQSDISTYNSAITYVLSLGYITGTTDNDNYATTGFTESTYAKINSTNFLSANTIYVSNNNASSGYSLSLYNLSTGYTNKLVIGNYLSANTVFTSSYALSALTDVNLSALTSGDILIYTGSTNNWKNVHTVDLYTVFYKKTEVDTLLNNKASLTQLNSALTYALQMDSQQTVYLTTGTTQNISALKIFISGITSQRGSGINNEFFGNGAGFKNSTGQYNTFLGYNSGNANVNGQYNTYIGTNAGLSSAAGSYNVLIGSSAGLGLTQFNNTIVGYGAGYNGTTINNNVFLGYQAGFGTLGNNNTLIGYQAGYSETGSNTLYITNNSGSTPLIKGDFSANTLTINGTITATNIYTIAQTDSNFLSANTSYYTQAQTNSNFLSANTSKNWLSANTYSYGSMNLASGSFSNTVGVSPAIIIANNALTSGSSVGTTIQKYSGTITVLNAGTYLINYSVSTSSTVDFSIALTKNTWSNNISVANVNPFVGSIITTLAANDVLGLYIQGPNSPRTINGYNLTVNRLF